MKKLWFVALALGLAMSLPAYAQQIDFGDDRGEWSNDTACDDPRFIGSGMSDTSLLEDDVMHDATDCRAQFKAGKIRLRGIKNGVIDFGNDKGGYAKDGACDDMRFAGRGVASGPLIFDDVMRDFTDCKKAFDAGQVKLVGVKM